jgi:hypothetical protein
MLLTIETTFVLQRRVWMKFILVGVREFMSTIKLLVLKFAAFWVIKSFDKQLYLSTNY